MWCDEEIVLDGDHSITPWEHVSGPRTHAALPKGSYRWRCLDCKSERPTREAHGCFPDAARWELVEGPAPGARLPACPKGNEPGQACWYDIDGACIRCGGRQARFHDCCDHCMRDSITGECLDEKAGGHTMSCDTCADQQEGLRERVRYLSGLDDDTLNRLGGLPERDPSVLAASVGAMGKLGALDMRDYPDPEDDLPCSVTELFTQMERDDPKFAEAWAIHQDGFARGVAAERGRWDRGFHAVAAKFDDLSNHPNVEQQARMAYADASRLVVAEHRRLLTEGEEQA